MRLVIVSIFVVMCTSVIAHAQASPPVALLPLDAEKKLEIYGQPVASEIARVLVAGGIDVVVVGPKMGVPQTARLVMAGTIKAGKGGVIALTVIVRDPRQANAVTDRLEVNAASMDAIDPAIEELSNKVLTSIKGRLAALVAVDNPHVDHPVDHVTPPPPPPPLTPMLSAISINTRAEGNVQPMMVALQAAVGPWALRRHHDLKTVELKELGGKAAPKAVTSAGADMAVWLEIQSVKLELGEIPMGQASVRVQISGPGRILFDRVIVTDTVVGDKHMTPDKLAARVAREVLDIAEPHLKKANSAWR